MKNSLRFPESMEEIFERYFSPPEKLYVNGVVSALEMLGMRDSGYQNYSSNLRKVWHRILREYGKYSCYALFLILPSDQEAIKYLTEFHDELGLITSTNCLAISLCTTLNEKEINLQKWDLVVHEHASHGYSAIVAYLFKISYDKFPCVLIFNDLRSPEHMIVSLKGMTAGQIAEEMRMTFSIIQDAVSNKEEPLFALEQRRKKETIKKHGKTAISELKKVAENTFEAVIEAWIKAATRLDS
jgi:hypothetical protein